MYTDIHSHVIWGVDDGAETREETFRMLRDAVLDGIGRIICTPHVTPGVEQFPEEVFQDHLWEAMEYIAKHHLPLVLYRGAELLYTENTPRLIREKEVATMAGTNYVLVEFSPTDTRTHILNALEKVSHAGVIPIIAHMERYPAIRRTEDVRELKSRCHALVQINARSLTRKMPLLYRRFFDSLFTENLVDFVATDTHSMPGREPCMMEGIRALKAKYGSEAARRIAKRPDILFE